MYSRSHSLFIALLTCALALPACREEDEARGGSGGAGAAREDTDEECRDGKDKDGVFKTDCEEAELLAFGGICV